MDVQTAKEKIQLHGFDVEQWPQVVIDVANRVARHYGLQSRVTAASTSPLEDKTVVAQILAVVKDMGGTDDADTSADPLTSAAVFLADHLDSALLYALQQPSEPPAYEIVVPESVLVGDVDSAPERWLSALSSASPISTHDRLFQAQLTDAEGAEAIRWARLLAGDYALRCRTLLDRLAVTLLTFQRSSSIDEASRQQIARAGRDVSLPPAAGLADVFAATPSLLCVHPVHGSTRPSALKRFILDKKPASRGSAQIAPPDASELRGGWRRRGPGHGRRPELSLEHQVQSEVRRQLDAVRGDRGGGRQRKRNYQ